jgi:hypothetical protein
MFPVACELDRFHRQNRRQYCTAAAFHLGLEVD